MAIDIIKEELLSLTEACKVLPAINGKRVFANCAWRWCRRGINGVCLDYVKIGGRMFTSAEALNRFANGVADADRLEHTEKQRLRDEEAVREKALYRPVRSLRRRRRPEPVDEDLQDVLDAEAELDEAGIR